MKLEDMWFANPIKEKVIPLPPPTKEVNQVKVYIQQIIDWVNVGDKEMECEIWRLLSEYAEKQAGRQILTDDK